MKTISEISVDTVIELLEAGKKGVENFNAQEPNNYSQGYIDAMVDALKLINHLKED